MSSLQNRLQAALDSRKKRNILRNLPVPSQQSESPLIDFYTSDYLSLSSNPLHRDRFVQRIHERYHTLPTSSLAGSGGSRLLVNSTHHTSTEARLTSFFNAPYSNGGLLFNSGFDANVGVFSTLPGPTDFIVFDEYIHASIHDGMRASRVHPNRKRSFKHNDLADLRLVLERIAETDKDEARNVFIAVEGLYSMDGDYAPLTSIFSLMDSIFPPSSSLQAHLIVDEAHSTCICGPQGRGLVVHLGLEHRVLVRLHTFGKAMAASGGTSLQITNSSFNTKQR